MPELKIENLTKQYGAVTALDHFSVTFTEGIYGLLGANGAGKSTLMNLITDNVKRQEGSILYNNTDILRLGLSFRDELGYMPQQQGFYDKMNAYAFLRYVASLKGMTRKKAKEDIIRLLDIVNLTEHVHKKVGGFSGGMKQRLLLAATLLSDPKVLILDEPTAGLDPKERVHFRNFISELSKDKIILIATHVVSDVENIADQILIIKEGKMVTMGSPVLLAREVSEKTGDSSMGLEEVYLYYFKE